MAAHIALALLLARLARPGPDAQRLDLTPVDPNAARIIWITDPGPGGGGGGATGSGPGQGPGTGPGLGPGDLGGFAGDVFRPGSGVTLPIELRRGTPRYTADAMRARLQDSVLVECVVEPDGACDRIRVTRGLEPSFGLNEEAVKAARQ